MSTTFVKKILDHHQEKMEYFIRKCFAVIAHGLFATMLLFLILKIFDAFLNSLKILGFIAYFDALSLGILSLNFFVASRILTKKGVQNVQRIFFLYVLIFILNFVWMSEILISKNEEITKLNWNLYFWLILLGIFPLALNPTSEGGMKKIFEKVRDPRSPIALALIFLIMAPFAMIKKYDALAEQFAVYAYLLLVIGVIWQLFVIRKQRPDDAE